MRQDDKRGRGGERREQILETALRLFAQHGMAHVSTRQIAQAVGISQPSLYAHFRTAHEISAELCLRAFDRLAQVSRAVLAEPGTPAAHFRRLGQAYIHFGLDHPDMYRMAFMIEGNEQTAALVREAKDPIMAVGEGAFDMLRRVIAAMMGTEAGGVDPATVELEAQSVWASVHGLTSLLIARPAFPWVERDRLIAHHLDTICARFAGNGRRACIRSRWRRSP